MPSQHTGRAFETALESSLLERGGWTHGTPSAFDRTLALFPTDFLAYITATQPELIADLRRQHGAFEPSLIDTLTKSLDSRGTLDVLRHGLEFFGKKIDFAYFRPAHGMNPDMLARYAQNRLVLTRQVKFIVDHDDSVDIVLALEGLPIATVELENHLTGQTFADAIAQYLRRDPRHALFAFKKRALVHFAVDPDLAYMTTRLEGADTTFLPFNRGRDGASGRPADLGDVTVGNDRRVSQRSQNRAGSSSLVPNFDT